MIPGIAPILIGLLGAMAGSFVNAWVWRLKQDKSVVLGRSECPHCKHTLNTFDLIPILSWLLLRGRCRYCKKPIGVHYIATEVVVVALFVLSYFAWDFTAPLAAVAFFMWLGCVTFFTTVAAYDQKWMEIPMIPLGGGLLFALALVILSVVSGGLSLAAGGVHVLASAFFFGLFWLVSTVPKKRKLLGEGDAYVMLGMGLLLGFFHSLVAVSLASYIGLILVLPGLIRKGREELKRTVAFGPLLMSGLFITVLYGEQIMLFVFNHPIASAPLPY